MPGGEEPNPTATETVNPAHTTTQIPLPGKFDEANSPQAAEVVILPPEVVILPPTSYLTSKFER